MNGDPWPPSSAPVLLPNPMTGEMHVFDPDHLNEIIQRTLGQAPETHMLVLGGGFDQNGATVAVAFSRDVLGGHLTARAALEVSPEDKRFAVGGIWAWP